jgi:plasmid stabilization system protein ParE
LARVVLEAEVLDDFDRIVEHLLQHDVLDAAGRIHGVVDALRILETSPNVGRPTADGFRELVIGTAARGYIALYVYDPERDAVFVVAVRGQKEAGYRRG